MNGPAGARRSASGTRRAVPLPSPDRPSLSLAGQRVRGALVIPADPSGATPRDFRGQDVPYVVVDRAAGDGSGCAG
ncbi:LacI family transcriptional regulator, partial [Streptomyces sp. GXMU-J5]|nr:LacI family transcriptional regulator [Streptomyces beihaiensis]